MSYQVRFTEEAEPDLVRLYEFILAKDRSDWSQATRALDAIKNGIRGWNFHYSILAVRNS